MENLQACLDAADAMVVAVPTDDVRIEHGALALYLSFKVMENVYDGPDVRLDIDACFLDVGDEPHLDRYVHVQPHSRVSAQEYPLGDFLRAFLRHLPDSRLSSTHPREGVEWINLREGYELRMPPAFEDEVRALAHRRFLTDDHPKDRPEEVAQRLARNAWMRSEDCRRAMEEGGCSQADIDAHFQRLSRGPEQFRPLSPGS